MLRVLVPTDFSETAWFVTRAALSWVETMGGEVLLLHVVPDMFLCWGDHLASSFIDQARLEAAYEELRAEGHRQFSTWLPHSAHGRCRTFVTVGETAAAILKVAEAEKVDVILMRAPKRRWWRPILAGSVTSTVMRRAPTPVVVWAGLGPQSAGGWWQGAWRPDGRDAPGEGARRAGQRLRWERTRLLKSW